MTNRDQLIKVSENEIAIIGIRKDGIVHIFYKDNAIIDKAGVNSMLALYESFLPKGVHPFIIESGEYVLFEEEGSKYTMEIEEQVPSVKKALVVTNAGYQLVANYYIARNKPTIDYGVFKTFDEALAWLKK
jgi:hypothetical protein